MRVFYSVKWSNLPILLIGTPLLIWAAGHWNILGLSNHDFIGKVPGILVGSIIVFAVSGVKFNKNINKG